MKDLKFCFKLLSFNPKYKSNLIVMPIAFFSMAIIFDIIALTGTDIFPVYPFIVPLYLSILPNLLENGFITLSQISLFRSSPIHKDFMVRLSSKVYLISSVITFVLSLILTFVSVAIRPDLSNGYMLGLISVFFSFAIIIPLSTILKSNYSRSVAVVAIVIMIPMFALMIFSDEILEFTGDITPLAAIGISIVLFIIQVILKLYVNNHYYRREYSDYYKKLVFEMQNSNQK